MPAKLREPVPAQRFVSVTDWQQRLSAAFAPVSMTTHAPAFSGAIRTSTASSLRVSRLTMSPSRVERTEEQIAEQPHGEDIVLCVPVAGKSGLTQNGRRVELAPGDLSFYDTSRPFGLFAETRTTALGLVVPKSLLAIPHDTIDGLLATRLSGDDPITALVRRTVISLEATVDGLRQAPRARAAQGTVGMLEMLCLHHEDSTGPQTTQHERFDSIMRFVDDNLGDPELSPGMIARAHYISIRAVHQTMHENGISAAGWIRRRRLERCRQDLVNPMERHRSVSDIASRWGMTNPSNFSTAFRIQYGSAPAAFRREHSE